jgi:hypothetical protein
VVCGGVWWCVVVCGGVWWCVVVCGGVWWCVMVCDCVLWCSLKIVTPVIRVETDFKPTSHKKGTFIIQTKFHSVEYNIQ